MLQVPKTLLAGAALIPLLLVACGPQDTAAPSPSPAASPAAEGMPPASPEGMPPADVRASVPIGVRARVASVQPDGPGIALVPLGEASAGSEASPAAPSTIPVEGEAVGALSGLEPGDEVLVTCRAPTTAALAEPHGLTDCAAVVTIVPADP